MSTQNTEGGQATRPTARQFPESAFQFVRDGLSRTVAVVHGDVPGAAGRTPDPTDESRHVSGQQLCMGLRDEAIRRYGLLARDVLGRWGVRRTDDFGAIVYAMIERGEFRCGRTDRPEDFHAVYDFDEAFGGALIG